MIFESIPYINIHSHHSFRSPKIWTLKNCFIQEYPLNQIEPISLGLHPWHLDSLDTANELLAKIENYTAKSEDIWAIGEAGLDKNIDFSMEYQLAVLSAHYEIAYRFKRPLIIHCVRAFNELLAWKKSLKNELPMLIHGFNRKTELLHALQKQGFYVSFGSDLCKNKTAVHLAFQNSNPNLFFLETDDAQDYNIEAIYEAAAQLKGISLEALLEQCYSNFIHFFNKALNLKDHG